MMRNAWCLFIAIFCGVSHAAFADDLDVIADSQASASQRGEAYERLTHVDFATIASKLARLQSAAYPPDWAYDGLGPRTKQPWNEEQLRLPDRIEYTFSELWNYHLANTKPVSQLADMLLAIVEDPAAQGGRSEALLSLETLMRGLKNSMGNDASREKDTIVPAFSPITKRLAPLANNPQLALPFREELVTVLYQYSDPNEWLAPAIELTDSEADPMKQAEAFRRCTPTDYPRLLTPKNRNLVLHHAYSLLEKIDDGHSGKGYFLALYINGFIDANPMLYGRKSQSFAPDYKSPKYHGEHGLRESFFQDTVNNARDWWTQNSSQYPDAPQ